MKSILLCVAIGLTLFTAQAAYAQDTTYHPLPDSLRMDTAGKAIATTSDTLSAYQLRQDSLKDSIKENLQDSIRVHSIDSLKQAQAPDSARKALVLATPKDSTQKTDSNQADTAFNQSNGQSVQEAKQQNEHPTPEKAQDSSKIVDIFEEMAAARDLQEQNIKNEAARKAAEKKAAQQAEQKAEHQQQTAQQQIQVAISEKKQAIQNTTTGDTTSSQKSVSAADPAEQPAHKDSLQAIKATSSAVDSITNQSANQPTNQQKQPSVAGNTTQQDSSNFTRTADRVTPDTSDMSDMAVNRDTIQSIFILPQPAGDSSTAADSANATSTNQPAAQIGADSASSSARPSTAMTDHNKKVKDSLDQLFAATADAAIADSSKSAIANSATNKVPADDTKAKAPHLTQVQTTGQTPDTTKRPANKPGQDSVTDQSIPKHPSDTSQVADIIDSLAPKNTPFTELFQPYRTFNKQTNITSTTSLTILQQNVDYKTSADFTTQYQRTGERAGNFLFDVSVVKLNTEVETMGVQLKYDSNKKTDSTSTFAKPLFDIVGKRTFIQVDSTGKITAIDSSRLGRQVNTVLSGLSLSGGDFEVGSNFGLLVSKPGTLDVGQQWTDSVSHGGNKRVTTYKVQSLLDGNLLVTISGTVSQTGEISSDGAIFKTHFTGTQNGKMYVDQQTLLVKSRDITLNMKGTVDYNGQSLPAAGVSKIKEKVTPD